MEPLTMNTQTGLNSKDPSFSPDGSMILFSSQQAQANGVMDIWEMLTSGSPQTQLTHGAGDSASPQMSLDGNFIAFVSKWNIDGTPTASSNIWEMNSDGTSPRYLTNNTASGEDSFFESGSVWVQSR
jgi:Tol biopolymer transport system component